MTSIRSRAPSCRGTAASWRSASEREIREAIWVAAEMRAGGAFAQAAIALEAMADKARQG